MNQYQNHEITGLGTDIKFHSILGAHQLVEVKMGLNAVVNTDVKQEHKRLKHIR